jgi:hypothetical protein
MSFKEAAVALTVLTLTILLLAACVAPQPVSTQNPTAIAGTPILPTGTPQPTPGIIDHPKPDLTVNTDISPDSDLGCDNYLGPFKMWVGAKYPIASCTKVLEQEDRCFREGGGLLRMCSKMVAYADGAFQEIGNQEELRELFAPIESADEALGYAMLATGYEAKYDPEEYQVVMALCKVGEPEGCRYYTDVIEDTHVVEIEAGYQVYLFDSKVFGCGPHPVWSVPVLVKYDGTIEVLPEKKLFEEDIDRTENICID